MAGGTGAQFLVSFLFQGDETWMDAAACKGLDHGQDFDIFFPPRGHSQKYGKEVCAGCPVQTECGEYADRTNTEYGIWAGKIRHRGTAPEGKPTNAAA